jgi:hypothetical protein
MKSIYSVTTIFIFFTSTFVIAQNLDGWGKKSYYNRRYDKKTFTEFTGGITIIDQFVPVKGMSAGILLYINTGKDTVTVHLGPKWYLEKQSLKLKEGDKVEVKGSKVYIHKNPVIIAREIIKEGNTLQLRDQNGIPDWTLGRR